MTDEMSPDTGAHVLVYPNAIFEWNWGGERDSPDLRAYPIVRCLIIISHTCVRSASHVSNPRNFLFFTSLLHMTFDMESRVDHVLSAHVGMHSRVKIDRLEYSPSVGPPKNRTSISLSLPLLFVVAFGVCCCCASLLRFDSSFAFCVQFEKCISHLNSFSQN